MLTGRLDPQGRLRKRGEIRVCQGETSTLRRRSDMFYRISLRRMVLHIRFDSLVTISLQSNGTYSMAESLNPYEVTGFER